MKRIFDKESLPKHLRLFAQELGGIYSNAGDTEFYEMNSVSEFEKGAAGLLNDDIKYEIIPPAIDTSTGRGFLVGFEIDEPKHIATLLDYSKLLIYFIEVPDSTIKEWVKKINDHREQQQLDAFLRKRPKQTGRVNHD